MADGQDGTPFLMAGTKEGEGHTLRGFLVQGGGGFVQEKEGLRQREGGGKEDALALAAGELGGILREKGGGKGQGTKEGGEVPHGRTVGRRGGRGGGPHGRTVGRGEGAVVLEVMGQADEICAGSGRGLEFLGDVGHLATDGIDVMDIEGKAADLQGLCNKGHETEEGAQQGGLATAALAGETNELTPTHIEVEVTE